MGYVRTAGGGLRWEVQEGANLCANDCEFVASVLYEATQRTRDEKAEVEARHESHGTLWTDGNERARLENRLRKLERLKNHLEGRA